MHSPDPVAAVSERSPVTSRALVLALVGIALLLLGALTWAAFGQAPETVVGPGVILPAGGYAEIGTRLEGVVDRVAVSPGDQVKNGDVVVTIRTASGTSEPVMSWVDGQVIDVSARPGRLTAVGEPMVIVEPADSGKIVTAFLPAEEAETIRPGMEALVSPVSAPSSQYGQVVGRVATVAPAPATRGRLLALLAENSSVADYFLANGPVQEVRITMNEAETPSGLEWTIGTGPDEPVAASTLASVSVVTADKTFLGWIVR